MGSAWRRIDSGTDARADNTARTVHEIAVETGVMVRISFEHVHVAGIFTHYADPEGNEDFTQEQHRRFLEEVVLLRPVAPDALLHTSGSAAILSFPEMHHDLVRLGISFYGYAPRAKMCKAA